MKERSTMSTDAWVSLLWAQYNKLSEPLKESFANVAQSMMKELECQNPNKITQEFFEEELSVPGSIP